MTEDVGGNKELCKWGLMMNILNWLQVETGRCSPFDPSFGLRSDDRSKVCSRNVSSSYHQLVCPLDQVCQGEQYQLIVEKLPASKQPVICK